MPINMTINITQSVGAGGKNEKMDVYNIQKQLNMHMNPPRKMLTEDGISGKKTIGTIRDFQRCVLGFNRPDGRVDPGGKTLRGLNNPASEGTWAGMSMMPQDYTPPPSAGPSGGDADIPPAARKNFTAPELTLLERLYEAIKKNHELKPAKDVLDDIVLNEIQILKALLAVQGISQWGIEVLQGFAVARRHGFAVKDIVKLMRNVYLARGSVGAHKASDEVIQFFRLFCKSPRLVQALKGLGKIAFVVTIVVTFLEAGNHFRKGDIGPGMAEIYGALMSIAIPWAGAMNALQGLLYAYYPGVQSPHVDAMFRVMLALDPIGAGKTAVDSGYTIAKVLIVSVAERKIPMGEIDKLVTRMKASPMRVWTDVGEDIGDWFGDQFGAGMLPIIKYLDL